MVLPYYRDGMKIMYDVEDLDAYLASKRIEPVAYGVESRPSVAPVDPELA